MLARIFLSKVGASVILALLIIGSALFVKFNRAQEVKSGSALAIEEILESSLDRDSDGDNLKDWEESLYRTDPANPDSDGDGTSDGDETLLGRNPLISGTDSKNNDNTSTSTEFIYTATDRFSQEIFKEYISAKQRGEPITDELTVRIAESVLSQDYSDFKPTYGPNDIRLGTDDSVSALKTYANALGKALAIPPAAKKHEMDIFKDMGTASVEEYREDLLAIGKRYEKILTNVLSISVPPSMATHHANIANSVALFIDAVNGALVIDEDPIGTFVKIGRYSEGIDLLQASILGIRKTLLSSKVAFTADESGYVLLR